ncbi:fimbrial protein [Pantoea sp. SORGH_AS_0659]|uniref:fimbrial protein n=1 Tax=Pantoea sp. SORGH_AS_0659 TaxID=3062597 RepID=UPI0028618D06|nr:fimbrial protein [Pantoea sp. SORGH_AS_0659]MDR6352454.1 major type 1 subunit fimbrin (pilin) [Pantoea sp. SORGH_AS_0659]
MFKKALVAAALLSIVSVNAAHAADGNLTFTGEILAATCTINGSAPGNINIPLGNFSVNEFGSTGTTAGNGKIVMELAGCPNQISTVKIQFEGTPDDDNPSLLKINGSATGLGIGIYETDGTPIPIGNSSRDITLTSGAAKAEFDAKFMSTANTVGAGSANATATYTLQYR